MSNNPLSQPIAPEWWHALNLSERTAGAPVLSEHAEVSTRRLRRWREETAFLNDDAFTTHLQTEALTSECLAGLLGESAVALQQRRPDALPWLADLYAAYNTSITDSPIANAEQTETKAGLLVLVTPLLTWASQQLRQRLGSVLSNCAIVAAPVYPFDIETAQRALIETLTTQLAPLLERTLVLEMHIARLQNLLVGETPAARFAAFLERLEDRSVALALLEEYPVLARQLMTKVEQTISAFVEILQRLVVDWQQLQATFTAGHNPGKLIEISIGAGDTHRNGRSVAILRFTNGLRLVYKPRSLAVDVHFQELLVWLNEQGAEPTFRPLAVLDQHEYGWVEFIAATACQTQGEVERFYIRQGGYLAILHLLSAADFHFENMIAAGEHPLLIDLEALFHPDIMEYNPNHPGELAQQALDQSVLSIGMLPQRMRFHATAATIDISGIGAAGTQLTPDKLPVWEGIGTDEMRLTRRHIEFTSAGHRPELNGQPIDVRAYAGAVAQGFAQIYRLLLARRTAFMAPHGPLLRFVDDEVRVVVRATRTYSLLLQESAHPDLLRNAIDRDRLYERLWKDVATAPRLARLVRAERQDLHIGDVPIFLARPSTTHLWDSRGQLIADFLAESGLARVYRRLDRMGDEDLTRQLWYIYAAFATLDGTNNHAAQKVRMTSSKTQAPIPSPEDLRHAARIVGDRLAGLAHQYQQHAIWIGLGMDEQASWSLAPLTMHLYDGHAGMALFFAYLGQITGEAHYTNLAEGALATLLVQAEPLTATFPYIGGFNGWGGLIYTLAHLGALWQRPDLWEKALTFAEIAATHVQQDEQFDVIGGAAGCIGAAVVLYSCTADLRLLTLIAQCADHLVAHAQPRTEGVGWIVPNMGGAPLAGFSHGAAGIAWALFKAAELCNNPTYHAVAQQALAYERSLFIAATGNWSDLRVAAEATPADEPAASMHAWCHGAPGIGLARLAMLDQLADAQVQEEITIALHSTMAHGFGGGHCLCHGDLGNVELLVKAATALDADHWLAEARRLAGSILADQAAHGWRCGVPGGVETPGLMVGLAGIGYELLRIASPTQVPSVLLLEPPYLGA
ncbi:N/A [soil metagenome]